MIIGEKIQTNRMTKTLSFDRNRAISLKSGQKKGAHFAWFGDSSPVENYINTFIKALSTCHFSRILVFNAKNVEYA
jgi:hypothetical protein